MQEYLNEITGKTKQMDFFERIDFSQKHSNVVIAGMGGSGISGKIFQDLYTKEPVITIDSYELPDFINHSTLFIAISYSGNTEETILATKFALNRGAKVFAITSGGLLSEIVRDTIIIPKGLQPRSSIGYLLNPLLIGSGIADEVSLQEAKRELEKINNDHNEIVKMADEIYINNKIPVIFGFPPLRYLAYRLKTQFNENAKILAYWSYFPELNHNDTMPLRDTYRREEFYHMALTFSNMDKRYVKRLKITSQICNFSFRELRARGNSIVAQLYSLIHLGDLLSYYVALRRNVDPKDVSVIEELKRKLNE